MIRDQYSVTEYTGKTKITEIAYFINRRFCYNLGTLNAGHPGGMLPLTAGEKDTLHSPVLPANLYVADATILPKSMGFPPIMTIMALAKRIASIL